MQSQTKVSESIVGKTNTGRASISFENREMAKAWTEKHPKHSINWFLQTITEEPITL